MNLTPAEIYWILRLDTFHELFVGTLFVSVFSFVIALTVGAMNSDFDNVKFGKKTIRILKMSAVIAIVSFLEVGFLPTTKQYIAMKMIPAVVNNEQIQSIGSNGLELIDAKIEEMLKDLKGN